MKPIILFQNPFTADQLQHLRDSFARPVTRPESFNLRRSIITTFTRVESAWISRPVLIGFLIFFNLLSTFLLASLLTK